MFKEDIGLESFAAPFFSFLYLFGYVSPAFSQIGKRSKNVTTSLYLLSFNENDKVQSRK